MTQMPILVVIESCYLAIICIVYAYLSYKKGWMMINHSKLDYHVTNFKTLSRWLVRTNKNSNPLL